MGLYDRYLAARIHRTDAPLPDQVAVVITERDLLEDGAYRTLESFFTWAFEYGAERVLVYVSVLDPAAVPTIRRVFERCEAPRPVAVRGPDDAERADSPIQVSIGLGGKHEFAAAVRDVATEVESGTLAVEEIDGDAIEDQVSISDRPGPRDQDRCGTPLRFHDLAVGLLRTLLHRRQLAGLPRA